jgi:hypothetical protein
MHPISSELTIKSSTQYGTGEYASHVDIVNRLGTQSTFFGLPNDTFKCNAHIQNEDNKSSYKRPPMAAFPLHRQAPAPGAKPDHLLNRLRTVQALTVSRSSQMVIDD